MLTRAVLSTAWLVLLFPAFAGAEPSVVLERKNGASFAEKVNGSCTETGLSSETRQRILNAAAIEWAEFRFPRYNLTVVNSYNVIPPGISPDEQRARARMTFMPRVLPTGYMEDDKEIRQRIGSYWAAIPDYKDVFNRQNAMWQASRDKAGWAEYWSAAFISFVMCKAGLKDAEFHRDSFHVNYIKPAVAQRDGTRTGYAFTAYDISEMTPMPGDLICAARDDKDRLIDNLQTFRAHPEWANSHCDVVVGHDVSDPAKAGVVYAIGGNVVNAVTVTEAPMSKGRLIKVNTPGGRNWFTVLKLVSNAGSASFKKIPAAVMDRAESVAKKRQEGAPPLQATADSRP